MINNMGLVVTNNNNKTKTTILNILIRNNNNNNNTSKMKIIIFLIILLTLLLSKKENQVLSWQQQHTFSSNYNNFFHHHHHNSRRRYFSTTTTTSVQQPFIKTRLLKQRIGQQRLLVSLLSSSSRRDDNVDDTDFPEYPDGDTSSSSKNSAVASDSSSYVSEANMAEQANELLLRTNTNNSNEIELQTELSNSFLQYALSIILGRAIPDARDGLKPVHRRILYAMYELQLYYNSNYRKCARVVGDVLGKLHPHGDTAVYDSLVRLAQDFTTNHPLIDGHGNFGSIDADPAAAMRYTECKLTQLSQIALLSDLNDDTVDTIPNFDGTITEPVVLPAKVPILLLNGSAGIAVGMATNIPPHNLNELLNACIVLTNGRIQEKHISTKQLLQIIPGPDFPTGASIMGKDGAKQLYTTGNGGIIMRAVTKIEQITTKYHRRGSGSDNSSKQRTPRTAIIVTELPYQVNKAALLEKIASLVNEKKLDGIADLRDESSGRDGIRVVIELKRDAVSAVVLANLYQKTALQTTFAGNFLALMTPPKNDNNNKEGKGGIDNNTSNSSGTTLVPHRFTLRQALDCFLDFRFETIRRKSRYQLNKVITRSHIVEGLLLALDKVDDVINVIRNAPDTVTAKEKIKQLLKSTNEQTDAILRLQLGQLTRLNKGKLNDEKTDLDKSKVNLTKLLKVDNIVYELMIEEFNELSNKFGVGRKTTIIENEDGNVDEIDLIRNSRSVIVVTRGGYIKRMPLKTFVSQRRGTRGKRGINTTTTSTDTSSTSTNDNDDNNNEIAHCFTCNDHDTLLVITNSGIAYGIRAYQVPISSRTARGQPIPSVIPQISIPGDVTTILNVSEFDQPNEYLLLVTENGWIKRTQLKAFENLGNRGLTVSKLEPGDRLRWCQRCCDVDDILIGSTNGYAIRFNVDKVRPTGRTSRGVRSMKLRDGDKIADVNVLKNNDNNNDDDGSILVISSMGFGKRTNTNEFQSRNRDGLGVIALKFKKNLIDTDYMTCLQHVKDNDEILLITTKGIMVRQRVSQITIQGRVTTGVLIQKLDDGDRISSVSIVPEYEETD